MSVLLVIPARYASSRFPGKPLAALTGATGESRTLLQRTWLAAQGVDGVDRAVIATDDARIEAHAQQIGAEVVMTSATCANGTERCAEAHAALGGGYEIIVNLQGDAPLTPHWFLSGLIQGLRDSDAGIATPVLRTDPQMLSDLKADRMAGRVGGTTAVLTHGRRALYFSKEVLPFSTLPPDHTDHPTVWHHVGVYAYRADTLAAYADWPDGPLERSEGLEQLRFLERGIEVLCVEVSAEGRQFWELNNPEDIPKIESMMQAMQMP